MDEAEQNTNSDATGVGQSGDVADSLQLLDEQDGLQETPEEEGAPGGEPHPAEVKLQRDEETDLGFGELEGVEGQDAGNGSARPYTGQVASGIEGDVQGTARRGGQEKEEKKFEFSQVVLDVVCKDEEEIDVAQQMPKIGMQKDRAQPGQAVMPQGLVRNQAPFLDPMV